MATTFHKEAEASHAARIRALFADLGLWLNVKHEARVHLRYREKFGNGLQVASCCQIFQRIGFPSVTRLVRRSR